MSTSANGHSDKSWPGLKPEAQSFCLEPLDFPAAAASAVNAEIQRISPERSTLWEEKSFFWFYFSLNFGLVWDKPAKKFVSSWEKLLEMANRDKRGAAAQEMTENLLQGQKRNDDEGES